MEFMDTLFAGIPLRQLLIIFCGILFVGAVVKKLFKLAVGVAIIVAAVYILMPVINNVILKQ